MHLYDTHALAEAAAAASAAASAERPAVTVVYDHPDARLLLFRIEPGQQVARHTNASSVFLTVVSGAGLVSGAEGERAVAPGVVACFEPGEPHGMRATEDRLVLSALITPRLGAR